MMVINLTYQSLMRDQAQAASQLNSGNGDILCGGFTHII